MRATTILFIIAFCLFINYETKAQCCPYINYVEILPENPMSNESIILVTSITTSNLGCFLESNLSLDSNNIVFEACYFEGNFAVITDIDSNFNIGMFNAGEYHLDFIAYDSYNPNNCVRDDTNSVSIDFVVDEYLGSEEFNKADRISIFPNPAKNHIAISNLDNQFYSFEITSVNGQVVKSREKVTGNKINVKDLQPGIYILKIDQDGQQIFKKLIKQ